MARSVLEIVLVRWISFSCRSLLWVSASYSLIRGGGGCLSCWGTGTLLLCVLLSDWIPSHSWNSPRKDALYESSWFSLGTLPSRRFLRFPMSCILIRYEKVLILLRDLQGLPPGFPDGAFHCRNYLNTLVIWVLRDLHRNSADRRPMSTAETMNLPRFRVLWERRGLLWDWKAARLRFANACRSFGVDRPALVEAWSSAHRDRGKDVLRNLVLRNLLLLAGRRLDLRPAMTFAAFLAPGEGSAACVVYITS